MKLLLSILTALLLFACSKNDGGNSITTPIIPVKVVDTSKIYGIWIPDPHYNTANYSTFTFSHDHTMALTPFDHGGDWHWTNDTVIALHFTWGYSVGANYWLGVRKLVTDSFQFVSGYGLADTMTVFNGGGKQHYMQ